MQLGLIGAGNMASALARGFGEPVLVADAVHEKAEALAAELGGEALGSNAEVAERADAVLLAHKPGQLEPVAHSTEGKAKAIVSILGGVKLEDVERAYPGVPVYRFLPSIPAEVRRGVSCYAPGRHAAVGPEHEVVELFERVGVVVRLDEPLIEPAMALMSCGPAFVALVAEAMVDAGVRHGLQPADASLMAVETLGGTAEVLRQTGHDTAGLRRRVTSPGGSTARGLEALERAGLRAAFHDAVTAVVEGGRR
ncbi:MAG TPA: pyrroline-5-carboxylate reductase [Thermoleophilaceae bacterium]|nr:pyrroline-5-carboxylate reductase [Thermoleophilaceae bacterium]